MITMRSVLAKGLVLAALGGGQVWAQVRLVSVPVDRDAPISPAQVTDAIRTCFFTGAPERGVSSLLDRIFAAIYERAPSASACYSEGDQVLRGSGCKFSYSPLSSLDLYEVNESCLGPDTLGLSLQVESRIKGGDILGNVPGSMIGVTSSPQDAQGKVYLVSSDFVPYVAAGKERKELKYGKYGEFLGRGKAYLEDLSIVAPEGYEGGTWFLNKRTLVQTGERNAVQLDIGMGDYVKCLKQELSRSN